MIKKEGYFVSKDSFLSNHILCVIDDALNQHNQSLTYREIGLLLQKPITTVYDCVTKMIRNNLISSQYAVERSLEITQLGRECLNAIRATITSISIPKPQKRKLMRIEIQREGGHTRKIQNALDGYKQLQIAREKGAQLQKARNHCHKGHQYTKENTYFYNGARICRNCKNISNKRSKNKCVNHH